MKSFCWRFDKTIPKTMNFYKTIGMNGSRYMETPLRSSAFLKTENNDKYCFFWPILASLHLCD